MNDSNDNQHSTSGRTMATIAILIAIIALTLAWMAYNRSGKDLEDSLSNSVDGTRQNVGEETQKSLDTVESKLDTGPDGVDDGAQ